VAEHAGDDPSTERRRAGALMCSPRIPAWRRFVLVEAGEPVIIGVAIHDIAMR
jgi:hypothetical protein